MERASRVFRPISLGRLRLASVDDAPRILHMVNESMSCNFRITGTPEIVYLIENAILSICQMDVNDSLVGFLAVRDYPVIPSVHPRAWEEYIWTKYKSIELNSRNTLFIHLVCWKPVYVREAMDNMLKSVFMHDAYVHHIVMVKSVLNYPLLLPGQSRAEASFRRVNASEKGLAADKLPALYIADRNEVSPRLRIRRAVEEDNDDIVPIIETHSLRLREIYGDYYISELIARHPDSERVLLVCEHKEVAVGVMCLNTQINFEALEESFQLASFGGLRKLTQPPKKDSKVAEYNASATLSATAEPVAELLVTESLAKGREVAKQGRLTRVFDEDEFQTFQQVGSEPSFLLSAAASEELEILQLLEDEEDEMEFDIINIDTNLLRVPKLLSYETVETGPVDTLNKILDGSRKDIEDKKKEKPKGTLASTPASDKMPELIHYYGAPNAFMVELLAMHHDYDERYSFDMLEVAYELFPDREYCIICFPSNQPSFPLLEHFTLVTPYDSRKRFINETLYVAHVNSVRGNFRVRLGEAYDMNCMYDICQHSPRQKGVMDLFESALKSLTLESYVLLSQNQPVGMAVLGPLEDCTTVRTQYELEPEPRRPGTDGMVLTGIVSPCFEPHYRWFMRELLRNSKYSTLFWISRLFAKGDASPMKHLTSIAGHMTPVHPRRSVPNISGNSNLDKIYKDIQVPFALWVLEKPLTSLPKVYVNNSIVVVGASRTGLAFLETLLLGPTCQYLTFSNVTLVSEYGLPTVAECLKAADTCVPRDGRYTDRYLKSVPFYFYVDVMTAIMVGIDRKKKCIHLKGGSVKYYDELVLTCGQQFQHPDYLNGPLQLVKEVEQGKPCERLSMDNPKYKPEKVPSQPYLPDNVMLINSLYEANIYLRRLLNMITEFSDTSDCLNAYNQVIVYGDCVEAYSCIAALLELGIFADMITFVEPFPPDDPTKCRVNCFNNETIDKRVQHSLDSLGIRVFRGYYLTGWQHHCNRVESINLMSRLQYITVPCFAMFYYGLKAIDVHAFKAINECGLVYDGGLVVDSSFETNDPRVFGAGTCVKYSRKLYAAKHAHIHYSSEDVGEALAKLFLKRLDPFAFTTEMEPTDLKPRYSSTLLSYRGSQMSIGGDHVRLSMVMTRMPQRWKPVMKFESPILQSATLPGPLYYMKLRKPGIEIPMSVQQCLPHHGHSLITDKDGNYFWLQLNVLHCVDAVTCLSKKQFSCEILSQLYGKHEAFFNKFLVRFKLGLISDLFEFFVQPWLSALYQETFQDLLSNISDQDVGTVYDLLHAQFKTYDEEDKSKEKVFKTLSSHSGGSIISEIVSTGLTSQEHLAGYSCTFRSVIDKFVTRKSNAGISKPNTSEAIPLKPTDIIPECGQNAAVRAEAASFWQLIGGERIVDAHLNRYLNKTSVVNSHYAVLDEDFI